MSKLIRLICFFSLPLLLAACIGGSGGDPEESCDSSTTVQIDFPFNYTIDTEYFLIQTSGGVLKTTIGPWGAHVPVFTGHAEGNAKSDWAGLYATEYSELTELSNTGSIVGTCEKGDVCGYPLASIQARIAEYVAPDDELRVTQVRLESVDTSFTSPFGNQHWHVEGEYCGYRLSLGHLQKISSGLRAKMIAAGYTDPWTVTTASSNLVTGDAVVLAKGETIAEPQIRLSEVSGHSGYYKGWGSYMGVPWAQIEYTITDKNLEAQEGGSHPIFRLFPQTVQNQILATMIAEHQKPNSFKYDQAWVADWLAASELVLYTVPTFKYDDYSSIFGGLGGWWERASTSCTPWSGTECDQMFSIFKLQKGTVAYDSSLYYSADIEYLVHLKGTPVGFQGTMFGEVLSPLNPDPVSGTMIIRWRRLEGMRFQGIAYRLNPSEKRLRIRWGTEVTTLGAVVAPSIPANTDACDGATTTCHSHTGYYSGSGGP